MKYIIILLGIIVLGIIIFSVIEEKTKYKDYEKEELNEKEKTFKALRFLIYIIIALLIPTVIYKILLWTEILKH
jgi:accessory gene regulator protein AgrB